MDMEEGLVEVETGMQAAIAQDTWFKTSVSESRVLSKIKNVPVPRFIVLSGSRSVYLELNIRTMIFMLEYLNISVGP